VGGRQVTGWTLSPTPGRSLTRPHSPLKKIERIPICRMPSAARQLRAICGWARRYALQMPRFILLLSTFAFSCGNVTPLPLQLDPAKPASSTLVVLGQQLFHDPRLSRDHTVSCASCHDLKNGGADTKAKSKGIGGRPTRRNSQTVINIAGAFAFFWDGRASTLEAQAAGPLLAENEMGTTESELIATLASIPEYQAAFEAQWPGQPVSLQHASEAIAAFERQLRAPSRFDRFLEGDRSAIDTREERGFQAFRSTGCTNCHQGSKVGGERFEVLGEANPWPRTEDLGRFELTGNQADRLVFRIPGLRNVARTAPYFHDGSVESLEEAVELMGWHQLNLKLSPETVGDIVAFLKSLDGELPSSLAAIPLLPPSAPTTPAPRPP
jgi:cytochrome c peroxidase